MIKFKVSVAISFSVMLIAGTHTDEQTHTETNLRKCDIEFWGP